ncbi:27462_t:CDS:2, partial [Racocetra persica]
KQLTGDEKYLYHIAKNISKAPNRRDGVSKIFEIKVSDKKFPLSPKKNTCKYLDLKNDTKTTIKELYS